MTSSRSLGHLYATTTNGDAETKKMFIYARARMGGRVCPTKAEARKIAWSGHPNYTVLRSC